MVMKSNDRVHCMVGGDSVVHLSGLVRLARALAMGEVTDPKCSEGKPLVVVRGCAWLCLRLLRLLRCHVRMFL